MLSMISVVKFFCTSPLVARQELPERSADIRRCIKPYAYESTPNARELELLSVAPCSRSAAINHSHARAKFLASKLAARAVPGLAGTQTFLAKRAAASHAAERDSIGKSLASR